MKKEYEKIEKEEIESWSRCSERIEDSKRKEKKLYNLRIERDHNLSDNMNILNLEINLEVIVIKEIRKKRRKGKIKKIREKKRKSKKL